MIKIFKILKKLIQIVLILLIAFPVGFFFMCSGFSYSFCKSCFNEGMKKEDSFPESMFTRK